MATVPQYTRIPTVSVVMTQILQELGLGVPNAFYAGTDQTAQQVLSLLNAAGQDLCSRHEWQNLLKTQTITGDGVTTQFALPDDLAGYCNGSMWNNTSRLPAIGSIPDQTWRMLKARLVGGTTISVQYRTVGNYIEFYQAPAAAVDIVIDYIKRGWVTTVAGQSRDNIDADDNVLGFPIRLLVSLTKLRWRETKQFDTVASQKEFDSVFNEVTGRDVSDPTLSIAPIQQFPYLGYINMPDTNYG